MDVFPIPNPQTLALIDDARQLLTTSPADALALARQAAAQAARENDGRTSAAAGRLAGQILRTQGRHEDAAKTLADAGKQAESAGDARLAAQVQIGRIDSLGWLGQYDEAVALAKRLARELRALGADEDAAKVLVNQGSLHFRRDRYALALTCYQQAEETLARSGDSLSAARVSANRANILMHLHRGQEALPLFDAARAIFAAEGAEAEAAMVETNAGLLRHRGGEYSVALSAFARAHAHFAERGQMLEAAKCDFYQAESYRALNLFPESLERLAPAVDAFARLGIIYEQAQAELSRAAAFAAQSEFDDAFASLERADELFARQRNVVQRAFVRLLRAALLQSTGREDEAQAEATRAVRPLTRAGLRGWAAEARWFGAEAAVTRGESGTRTLAAIVRAARKFGRGWLECRAEQAWGRHHAARGQTRLAVNRFRRSVAALEQARTLIAPEELHVAYMRDKIGVYEDLIRILLARGRTRDIAEALEYVERAKSRLLLERMQSAMERRADAGEPSEKLLALRARLSEAYHQMHATEAVETRRMAAAPEDSDTLAPLENEYRHALRDWELRAGDADAGPFVLAAVASVDELRDALEPDETLVEFYIAKGSVCAFVLNQNGLRVRADLADWRDVDHAARRLRYHLQQPALAAMAGRRAASADDVTPSLARLYELLLRPLEPLLSTEKLVLVPHGGLHGLPFHAFWDGARYALDRWECVFAPSAAVWRASVRRAASASPAESALIVGVPDPGLAYVAAEIGALARVLPQATVLEGDAATRDAFLGAASSVRLLHLATHALFRADNPLFSGLRLCDGWLLARDVYALRLSCDLVTLSACRTGVASVAPGDELFGLLRGFLAAGARAVAASLWPADDQSTAFLMTRFYTHLASGASRAASLRAAQCETRDRCPHPYHWAAFALVGAR